MSYKSLRTLQFKKMVHGLPQLAVLTTVCKDCMIGKQQRDPFPKKSIWRASQKFQLIHADLCGPITPISNSNKSYTICFIDDFSRKTWVHYLVEKSEAFSMFKYFKSLVEKETGTYIKCLHTDRGGEFTSQEFNQFCKENGIKRQLTAAYTPQQNRVAERKNRTILNMVWCMLSKKKKDSKKLLAGSSKLDGTCSKPKPYLDCEEYDSRKGLEWNQAFSRTLSSVWMCLTCAHTECQKNQARR